MTSPPPTLRIGITPCRRVPAGHRAARVEEFLKENRLRLGDLLQTLYTRSVAADELVDVDAGLASLRNLNTPDDYAAALRDLGGLHLT